MFEPKPIEIADRQPAVERSQRRCGFNWAG